MTPEAAPRTAAALRLAGLIRRLSGYISSRDIRIETGTSDRDEGVQVILRWVREDVVAIEAEAAAGTALDVERLARIFSGYGIPVRLAPDVAAEYARLAGVENP